LAWIAVASKLQVDSKELAPDRRGGYFFGMQAFQARLPPLMTEPDGVVRVSGTRVSLETVVAAFDEGATAEEIVQRYPSLELAAVYAVIAYVLDNRFEVAAYVTARRRDARALQEEIEAQFPPHGLRERLLARRTSGQ
jgi:uncharacterized protein (DUF433 family)